MVLITTYKWKRFKPTITIDNLDGSVVSLVNFVDEINIFDDRLIIRYVYSNSFKIRFKLIRNVNIKFSLRDRKGNYIGSKRSKNIDLKGKSVSEKIKSLIILIEEYGSYYSCSFFKPLSTKNIDEKLKWID